MFTPRISILKGPVFYFLPIIIIYTDFEKNCLWFVLKLKYFWGVSRVWEPHVYYTDSDIHMPAFPQKHIKMNWQVILVVLFFPNKTYNKN